MDNCNTTAPPHSGVYYPATNMGPPPSVSPIHWVEHSSQPSSILDMHSYPQSNWGMVTPPNANAQYSSAFVSPTKGAAHWLQPPTEDPMSIYGLVIWGQSNTVCQWGLRQTGELYTPLTLYQNTRWPSMIHLPLMITATIAATIPEFPPHIAKRWSLLLMSNRATPLIWALRHTLRFSPLELARFLTLHHPATYLLW